MDELKRYRSILLPSDELSIDYDDMAHEAIARAELGDAIVLYLLDHGVQSVQIERVEVYAWDARGTPAGHRFRLIARFMTEQVPVHG